MITFLKTSFEIILIEKKSVVFRKAFYNFHFDEEFNSLLHSLYL
jgi:hypothetical protein